MRLGGTVVVFERDRPVAHIVPVVASRRRSRDEDRLARLERKGLIRRGRGDMAEWLRKHPPVRGAPGLLKIFLAERRSGW